MDDRELLELAAKASGLKIQWSNWYSRFGGGDLEGFKLLAYPYSTWNPLTDDGDAFRLSVELNFEIERSKKVDRAYVGPIDEAPWVEYVNDEQDIYACTRRAIVQAAAEIGRKL